MANGETEKVESFREVNDTGLFLREGQTTLLQPCCQDALHVLGIFFRFTEADEIVGIPHNCTLPAELTAVVVFDPDSLFHPVQRNIRQQRRHHAPLRRSLLRCMKCPVFHISCFQPLLDQFLPRNRANGFEQILV